MALDGSLVRPNPGTLSFGGAALGLTDEGVELWHRSRHEPIQPEELGEFPLDYIMLGGPIFAIVTLWQWDDATRAAIAQYAISGSTLVLSTAHAGKKLTALGSGAQTLSFAPTTSGHNSWTASRAVPLIGEQRAFNPKFRKREVVKWAATFALLPPADGGTILTITTS